MADEKLVELYEDAVEKEDIDPARSEQTYKQLIQSDVNEKTKENAIYKLGGVYAKQQRANDLISLTRDVRPFFVNIPKAKTAKIVRTLIDLLGKIPGTENEQIQICKESIEWCKEGKRTFLRQRIETRLSELYLKTRQYQLALALINPLLRELKKLDDKALLVELQLIESQIQHALRNIPKAKGALTASRTAANAIYCPPSLQAALDLQAGILHAEEKDYRTGFSYFYEAFEGYGSLDDPLAVLALKYMLMCKIMMNATDDINTLITARVALKYSGANVDAMKAVAAAQKRRSLKDFEDATVQYKAELMEDRLIQSHLNELYDMMLEQNLSRLIEPFSSVEVVHIAKLINLPVPQVEAKLSHMILDEKFYGTLDQSTGSLLIFEEPQEDKTYTAALNTVDNLGKVVESLYSKARQLH